MATALGKGTTARRERKKAAANQDVASVFLTRSRRALEAIADTMPPKQLAEFAEAASDAEVLLRAVEADLLSDALDNPLARAQLRGAKMQKDMLKAAQSVSSRDFAGALGVTPQAVNKGRRAGAYLGLPVGEQYLYPLVQLKGSRIVRGLKEVLAALPVESPWTKLSFLMGEDANLGGRPIDRLKAGDVDGVVKAAGRYAEHGAA